MFPLNSDEIVFLGTFTVEHLLTVNHLPAVDDGGLVTSETMTYGGRGAIPAVTYARLGGKPTLLGAVGRDFESSGMRSFLQQNSVDTSLLKSDKADDSFSTNIYVDSLTGETYTFFWRRSINAVFSEEHRSRINGARFLYIASNFVFDFASECIAAARDGAVPVVANLCNGILPHASDDFLELLVDSAQIIVFNDVEWNMARSRMKLTTPIELFRRSPNLKCVFHTKGSVPGVGYLPDQREFVIPIRTPRVTKSTVGAGDTFIVVVLSTLLLGYGFEEAARLGSLLASVKVEGLEPILELEQLREAKVEVEALLRVL